MSEKIKSFDDKSQKVLEQIHIPDLMTPEQGKSKGKVAEFGLTLVDIGGTKERILVVGVDREGNILRDVVLAEKEIPTPVRNLPVGDKGYFYDTTADVIGAVQSDARNIGVKVLPLVCIGTPGRLVNGRIALGTAGNLGRSFDNISPEEELSKRLNQDVHAINDAISQMGYGTNELTKIPEIGEKLRHQRVCYIGPGTGLGGGFCRVNEDFSLEYFTDGHIFDIKIPRYTGLIPIEFELPGKYQGKKINEHHRVGIQSRFAEDVLSGRAVRQIACEIDRHLIEHGKEPLFLSLVSGYEHMTERERTKALAHNNNKSPVNAKLIDAEILGKKDLDENRERALPTAEMLARFQGEMMGRLIECIYIGNIEKSTEEAQWSAEDIEKVKGTTNFIIGGSAGTKGEMGRIARETAIGYLRERFPDVEFNLFTIEQTENAGALGTASFLKRADIMGVIERVDVK